MLSDESKGILLERGAIINLNKPVKMTSHDCVAKLRGILGIRKIGHTGTLDPHGDRCFADVHRPRNEDNGVSGLGFQVLSLRHVFRYEYLHLGYLGRSSNG